MRIAVADSGVGNVHSVLRAVTHAADHAGLSARTELTADLATLRRADALVVPGQGAFGAIADAMQGGLGEVLGERIRAGAPYLGICLGLQVLFEGSDEAPGARGLGILRGHVARLEPGLDPSTGRPHPLPHIGWNAVEPGPAGGDVLPATATHFYFAHSYAAVPEEASVIAGTCVYGRPFVAAVARDNVLGVQFHPEKSQREGLAVLARFFQRLRRG